MQKNQDKIKSHFNDSIKTMQNLASRILNFTKLITKLAILFHLGIKSNLKLSWGINLFTARYMYVRKI